MRIGITFDLKSDPPGPSHVGGAGGEVPDDLQEEFDSPITIEAIARVLRGLGHDVVLLGDGRELLQRLLADPPHFVFNFAEGQGVGRSREARVPAVLEMLGIPYSGSDPLTLAVTLDKDVAKRLAASAGVRVPEGFVVPSEITPARLSEYQSQVTSWPVLVKPAWEGSSKGIRQRCLVDRADELAAVIATVRRDHHQPVLVEQFIQGEEVTVGVIGNDPPRVFGMLQVVPTQPTTHFVYSLEVKRDYKRRVRYEVPPKLPANVLPALEQAALKSYQALGCRDVSRVDFRIRDGIPYFLEVNPLPGLHPDDSDLVYIAKGVGWSYERLIGTILDAALKRLGLAV
jgi:D-alanine-D-alanine ligase